MTQLTLVQEARFAVLQRMRHARWCPWKEQRDCRCKAGRAMLALIEAETEAIRSSVSMALASIDAASEKNWDGEEAARDIWDAAATLRLIVGAA